jgi:glyoxylase-like metal-dependent hydrolase (beta-lactamase superfamily II)
MDVNLSAYRKNSSAVQPAGWQSALPRPAYRQYTRIAVTGPAWYEVYQLFPDVYTLYEPGHFQEVISFLIIGRHYALLWDTGMGISPIRPVVEQLTALPILPVNSHQHFDHVGGNREFPFVCSWPGPGSAERAATGYGNDFLTPMLAPESFALPLPPGCDLRRFSIRPWRPVFLHPQNLSGLPSLSPAADTALSYLCPAPAAPEAWPARTRSLHTGLAFDLGDRKLDILLTPGHTPDSIMLADRERRLLFTGDACYPAALYAHFDSVEYGQSSLDIYASTMHSLQPLAASFDALCCSHNVPVCPPVLLEQVAAGFAAAQRGDLIGRRDEDGLLRYDFDGFAIITK